MRMQFDEFVALIDQYQAQHPELRYGQCVMNALHAVRPGLYDRVVEENLDCFYTENPLFIAETLTWLREEFSK